MADTTKTNEAKISIKVIVDKVNKRVVYAEADHTFVDILFSFMTYPLGTIVKILEKHADQKIQALGSLNNLYQSLKDFPASYFATEECKFLLLNPRSLLYDHCTKLKLILDDTEPLRYFRCATCPSFFPNQLFYSTCTEAKCRNCGKPMKHEVEYTKALVSVSGGHVFVPAIATFIVTDDLCVMPYTSASCIRLLTDFGYTDKSCLEDIKLDLDYEQILNVLKMMLSLDSVLSHLVFQRTICIRELAVHAQSSTFELSDIVKKEAFLGSQFHLEVSLQKSTGKLLFAETSEDFVDFLFGILSIPLGTVVGELIKGESLKCVNNILRSISSLSVGRYFLSQDIKNLLLKPHFGQQYSSKNQLFPLKGTPFHHPESYFKDPRLDGKLLKRYGMFIVTDDLIVTPSSSSSTISILNDLKVSFDDIEKYEICIGLSEGLKMLKASLRSCSTMTHSFGNLLKK